MAKVPRVLKIPPGEVFHTIEAPKGVLGFTIRSNGTRQARAGQDEIAVLHQPPVARAHVQGQPLLGRRRHPRLARHRPRGDRQVTPFVADVLIPVGKIVAVILYPMVMVMVMIWLERRVVALMQGRLGPNRVGFQGVLQPVADAVKLFFKEDIIQRQADKLLFNISPDPGHVLVAAGLLLHPPRRAHPHRDLYARPCGSPRARSACSSSWACRRSPSSASSSAAGPRTPSTRSWGPCARSSRS